MTSILNDLNSWQWLLALLIVHKMASPRSNQKITATKLLYFSKILLPPCILFSTPLISIKIPISAICSHLLSVALITIPTVFAEFLSVNSYHNFCSNSNSFNLLMCHMHRLAAAFCTTYRLFGCKASFDIKRPAFLLDMQS